MFDKAIYNCDNKNKRIRKFILGYMIFYFFSMFAVKNVGLTENVKYLFDICNILLVASLIFIKHRNILKSTFAFVLLILIAGLLSCVLNSVDLRNYLFGIRMQYLQMAMLFAASSFLTLSDYNKMFKFMFWWQFVNLAACLFQYFVLGYYQDLNNGAFYNGASQDVFCTALVAYYYLQYINKSQPLWKFIFVVFSSLVIAGVEEEKFMFIMIAFVFIYINLLSGKIGFKSILLLILGVVAIAIGLQYLSDINGEGNLDVLTSKEGFEEYGTMTGGGYNLPRIGSSLRINNMFFHKDWQDLLGLGLGACEHSTLPGVDQSFYQMHGWLNYEFFTFQSTYLQSGLIGIILLILVFVSILVYNFKFKRICKKEYKMYYDFSTILSFLSIALIWYNATYRGEFAVLPYFLISMAPALSRNIDMYKK